MGRTAVLIIMLIAAVEAAAQPPVAYLHDAEFSPSAAAPHLTVRPPQSLDAQGRSVDPRYSKHEPSRGSIPEGVTHPGWRTPYAYGYFGARPSHQWHQHFGYMRQYHQWMRR